jgi:hypothetical protein
MAFALDHDDAALLLAVLRREYRELGQEQARADDPATRDALAARQRHIVSLVHRIADDLRVPA